MKTARRYLPDGQNESANLGNEGDAELFCLFFASFFSSIWWCQSRAIAGGGGRVLRAASLPKSSTNPSFPSPFPLLLLHQGTAACQEHMAYWSGGGIGAEGPLNLIYRAFCTHSYCWFGGPCTLTKQLFLGRAPGEGDRHLLPLPSCSTQGRREAVLLPLCLSCRKDRDSRQGRKNTSSLL